MISPAHSAESLLPNISRGYQYVAVTWSFVSVAFVVVFLRLWIRGLLRRKVGGDDYTIVAALVFTHKRSENTVERNTAKIAEDMCPFPELHRHISGQGRTWSIYSICGTYTNQEPDSRNIHHYTFQYYWHHSCQNIRLSFYTTAATVHRKTISAVRLRATFATK